MPLLWPTDQARGALRLLSESTTFDLGWMCRMIDGLAVVRPVFHSEADLQLALGWAIHQVHPSAVVRLEARPDPDIREAVDVRLHIDGVDVFIELKYLVRSLDVTVGDERFVLRNQGAQPLSRYDVAKDIGRLERFTATGGVGFAVVLSNDPAYWRLPAGNTSDTIDHSFRIHHGATLHGQLPWAPHTGAGTNRGRAAPISLAGSYALQWREWQATDASLASSFRYLVVAVPTATRA